MELRKINDLALKVLTGLLLALALVLTFTVSDYYIFNKFTQYNPAFILSQWAKKVGLLILPLAVYLKKRSCADIAKYFLPVFVIISMCTYGNFFDITKLTADASPADKVYASINEFIPKSANMTMFFISSALYLIICGLIFVRDGFKASGRSFVYLPFAVVAAMPLNIFENFYDTSLFDKYSPNFAGDSFWLFKSFSVWHLLVVMILIAATIGCYYFLKNKSRERQNEYLVAMAIVLLIHYHSKDSVIMGDGYNVYKTVFACVPLFICNIGVYVACLSVMLKKRVLYSIAFFVHAAGALSVFFYFGRDNISNYGIFIGYSIVFFCVEHCLLFILSIMPTALGHYKFTPKDAIIPLIYYCIVIIIAAIASGLVTSASMTFSYDGYTLREHVEGLFPNETEWLFPNYAFTQINPTPVPEPFAPLVIWRYTMNWAYLIILYLVYVGLFYIFNAAYYIFLEARKAYFAGRVEKRAAGETAAADETQNGPKDDKK